MQNPSVQTFRVLDRELTFNSRQIAFANLWCAFRELSRGFVEELEDDLQANVGNLAETMSLLSQAVDDCVDETATLAIDQLCQIEIFDCDEERFRELLISQAYERNLFAPLVALGAKLENIDRIEGGGGIGLTGGGFGAAGAIQGMAIAGAANLLTGAVSKAAAAVERSAAKQVAAAELKTPANRKRIFAGFEQLVELGLSITAKIASSSRPEALEFPSDEDQQKASAIIANIARGRVPEARRDDLMAEALARNPYDPAGHVLLHSAYGSRAEHTTFSDFLGIDVGSAGSQNQVQTTGFDADKSLRPWSDELKEICTSIYAKDLHISPYIPEHKLAGAMKNYLRKGVAAPHGHEEYALEDIGSPVALIDITVFGGGGDGITFTTRGFSWKDAFKEPRALSWSGLRNLDGNIKRTTFGVRLFDHDLSLSGVSVSKDQFETIMKAIAQALERRNWQYQ